MDHLLSRHQVARLLAIVGLLVVAGISAGCSSRPLTVVFHNDSPQPTPRMMLVPNDGATATVPAIAPGGRIEIRPVLGGGENALALIGPAGREYEIRTYFEGTPSGTIDVTITGQTPELLLGTVDDNISYFPQGHFKLKPWR